MNRLQILLVGIVVLLLVGCGNDGGDPAGDTTPSPEVDNSGISCAEVEVTNDDGDVPNLNGCMLRVAVENGYSPFNLIDSDTEEGVGYDYDIFDEICDLLNCELEFVEVSWEEMVSAMESGDFSAYDVVANGVAITDERLTYVDFSDPYISLSQVMLVRADEERFTESSQVITDTASFSLGSQPGTTNYDSTVELVGKDRVKAYDGVGSTLEALVVGYVDAVIVDEVTGSGYESTNRDVVKLLELPDDLLAAEKLGFMFAKGSALTNAVNLALSDLEDSRQQSVLFDKWFSVD